MSNPERDAQNSRGTREAEEKAQFWKDHAEALDKNWERHHNRCVDTLRKALHMEGDVCIPEMVQRIHHLLARCGELE